MSDKPQKCTPQEIEEKRRQALEKYRKTLELKKSKQNAENRRLDQGKVQLTEQQKAEIERKRVEAIERAKANKLISLSKAENLKKISPGKAPAPSKEAVKTDNRTNPYLKPQNKVHHVVNQAITEPAPSAGKSEQLKALPPSKAALTSNRVNPYQKPVNKFNGPSNRSPPVKVILEMISKERFVAKIDAYSESVIKEFKKLQTKSYNQQTRTWSFHLNEYDKFVKNFWEFSANGGNASVQGIPDFVRNHMKKPEPKVDESCLEAIEEGLVNSLLQFQREAVCFGIARNGRFLLADDMGLGKTRQALAVADFFKEDWPLLIISTASTRSWWQRQILDLLPKVNVMDIHVMESTKDSIMAAKVLICSYSSLENNMKRLLLKEFGMVILDESHNIKNSKSKQTTNAKKICEKAKHVIMISGTPALSRPAELYEQLSILDPSFTTYYQFTTRFCDGKDGNFGWTAQGSTHLDELNVYLRSKFMIRRTKEEVYSELGGKNREVVELQNMQMKKAETEGMQEFSNQYHSAEGKKQQQKEILLHWYNETAKLKVDAVCRYIEDFVSKSEEKCLIFVHHVNVMDEISKCLSEKKVHFMCISGTTKAETRDSNVQRFQEDPSMRCAVLSLKACSAGITLTAASTVIFAELDWTPSTMIQAEARAHRIGQERQVTCIYLIAPNTADEVMWRMLQEKQRNLTKAGLVTTDEHLSQNVVKSTFVAGPSTSAEETPKITNYFTPNTSPNSDTFYTCETAQEMDSDDILNGIDLNEIEKLEKSKETELVEEILDGIVFEDDDDFVI